MSNRAVSCSARGRWRDGSENCQSACKPGSVGSELPGDHSSGTALARRLEQPTRTTGPEKGWCLRTASSLFGLAPGGVCPAALVAKDAVGSYPTVSPLPRQRFGPCPIPAHDGIGEGGSNRRRGGLFSVALSLGSPPPDVIRHRFSVEPGLSSPRNLSVIAERGCPANWLAVHSRGVRQLPETKAKSL